MHVQLAKMISGPRLSWTWASSYSICPGERGFAIGTRRLSSSAGGYQRRIAIQWEWEWKRSGRIIQRRHVRRACQAVLYSCPTLSLYRSGLTWLGLRTRCDWCASRTIEGSRAGIGISKCNMTIMHENGSTKAGLRAEHESSGAHRLICLTKIQQKKKGRNSQKESSRTAMTFWHSTASRGSSFFIQVNQGQHRAALAQVPDWSCVYLIMSSNRFNLSPLQPPRR